MRERVLSIGYDSQQEGLRRRVVRRLGRRSARSRRTSPRVSTTAYEERHDHSGDPLDRQGAGDQGLMFGYAARIFSISAGVFLIIILPERLHYPARCPLCLLCADVLQYPSALVVTQHRAVWLLYTFSRFLIASGSSSARWTSSPPHCRTSPPDYRLLRVHLIRLTAARTNSPPGKPPHEFLFIHLEVNHRVQGLPTPRAPHPEPAPGNRSREPIQYEPRLPIESSLSLAMAITTSSGTSSPLVHVALRLEPDLGLICNGLSQYITRRYVRGADFSLNRLAWVPFPAPGGPNITILNASPQLLSYPMSRVSGIHYPLSTLHFTARRAT